MKGRIAEVFQSIQGEGLYLGQQQVFVRFFSCNLRCRFCDTKPDRFFEYEPEELFREIKLYDRDNLHAISFTGGEPLLQNDFLKNILRLTRSEGYKNYLETNGTLWLELAGLIDDVDIVAMDLKLPSSSGMGSLWSLHRRFLEIASHKEVFLKAIICKETKEEDLKEAINLIREVNPAAVLILQPNSYEHDIELEQKMQVFKKNLERDDITSCIIPQLHRIVEMR